MRPFHSHLSHLSVLFMLAPLAAASIACGGIQESQIPQATGPSEQTEVGTAQLSEWNEACTGARSLLNLPSEAPSASDIASAESLLAVAIRVYEGDPQTIRRLNEIALKIENVARANPGVQDKLLTVGLAPALQARENGCYRALAQSGATLAYAVLMANNVLAQPDDPSVAAARCSNLMLTSDAAYVTIDANPTFQHVVRTSDWVRSLRTVLADNLVLAELDGTRGAAPDEAWDISTAFGSLQTAKFVTYGEEADQQVEYVLRGDPARTLTIRTLGDDKPLQGTWSVSIDGVVTLTAPGHSRTATVRRVPTETTLAKRSPDFQLSLFPRTSAEPLARTRCVSAAAQ